MKRTIALLLVLMLSLALLAGCQTPASSTPPADSTASTSTGDSSAPADKEFVKLSFYMMNSPVNDFDRVMEKANAIIKDKINAELDLVLVDSGTYAEKVNLMINSAEEFDLCFMANWGGINFFDNAAAGAFADITDLLPTYAPETYSRIPEALWQGVTVGGKVYASVNYQQWGVAQRKGFSGRLDLADESNFDWQALKGQKPLDVLTALEPFIDSSLKAHPEMIGWETTAQYSFFNNDPLYWDMDPVGDTVVPGWIRYEDPDVVINQFETEEFAQYCDIMREYYNKGYVRKDGATLQDHSPDRQAGKIVAANYYAWPDLIDYTPTGVKDLTVQGFEDAGYPLPAMSMTEVGQAPAWSVSTTRTVIPAAAAPTACVAISATSKNPERAMELIELLNTNDELFNLIQWGEEGVDYEYDADGNFVRIEGMYNFNYNEWQIGQSYNPDFTRSDFGKNQAGEDQKAKCRIVFAADLEADPSPVTGFEFNPDAVKTEITNCGNVVAEMVPLLSNGAVDPATALPEFLQRLKDAGVDAIIAEKQAQYDAWRNA